MNFSSRTTQATRPANRPPQSTADLQVCRTAGLPTGPGRLLSRVPFALTLALGAFLFAGAAHAQPGHTAGLAALADVPQLIATVQKADATLEARARACQQLALVGGHEAVAPLAALLGDATLSHYARTALEEIRDPAVDPALRAALEKTTGLQRLGIIHSLGVRRDIHAAEPLARLAKDSAQEVATASLLALAQIGTPAAAQAIHQSLTAGPAALRPAAAEATLRLAELTAARGATKVAAELYDQVRSLTELPAPTRLAALRGAILTHGSRGLPILRESLQSTDLPTRQLALRVARELPDRSVAKEMSQWLETAAPELQLALLRVLADRGGTDAHAAVESLATRGSPAVRLASLETLGTVGNSHSIPVLVAALKGAGNSPESDAAAASLARIPAKETESFLLAAIPETANNPRAQMILALGARGSHVATAEILRQATNLNATVARAAFEALAFTARAADLPAAIRAALAAKDTGARDRAERTLYTVALKNTNVVTRAAPLIAALRDAPHWGQKKLLLQVLAMLGDAPSAQAIATSYGDPEPEVRTAVLQHLSHWPDATPVPELLRIFTTTKSAEDRLAALKAIATLATASNETPVANAPRKRPSPEAIRWLSEAKAAVRADSPEEKRALLSGLADLNSPEGLRLIEPYLADDSVKTEAIQAGVRAAKGLVDADRAAARTGVEKLLPLVSDPDDHRQLEALLR